jgi:outer membrane lipoprotein-sorting protein
MRIQAVFGVLAIALLALQPAAPAADLAEVEAQALAAWEGINAFTSGVELEATLPMNTLELEVSGKGKMLYQRLEGAEKYRQNLTLTLPDTVSMESKVDILYDGNTLYLTNEMLGNRETVTSEVNFKNGAIPPGGEQLFALLHANFNTEVLADGEVDGAAAWVLEGTLKDDAAIEDMPFQKIVLHLDQASGMVRRTELVKGDGSTGATIRYTDVQLNPDVDPQLFDFTPPKPAEPEPEAAPAPAPADAPPAGGAGGAPPSPPLPPPPPPATPPAAQGSAAT